MHLQIAAALRTIGDPHVAAAYLKAAAAFTIDRLTAAQRPPLERLLAQRCQRLQVTPGAE